LPPCPWQLSFQHACPLKPIKLLRITAKSSKLTSTVSDKVNNEELRRWLEGLNDEDLGRYKM